MMMIIIIIIMIILLLLLLYNLNNAIKNDILFVKCLKAYIEC